MAKTQTECRYLFSDLVKVTVEHINHIDKLTPADPNYPDHEPDWWVEMLEIQRKLNQWNDRYGKL